MAEFIEALRRPDFKQPEYDDKWDRNFYFEKYNDKANYFIDLEYCILRDKWETRLGADLNFGVAASNGRAIFRNFDFGKIRSRGYKLLHEDVSYENTDQDVYRVRETYGYAPAKTFTEWTFEPVPLWGIKDTDYAAQSALNRSGNYYSTRFYNRSRFSVADPSKFKTGDYIMAIANCQFGHNTGTSILYAVAPAETSPIKIERIIGNTIELSNTAEFSRYGGNADDDNIYYSWLNYRDYGGYYINDSWEFFSMLNGGPRWKPNYLYMRPISGYVLKAYSTREYKKRLDSVKNVISYHTTEPDTSQYPIFIPQQQSGLEYTSISLDTTMTPATWKAKVARGDWFIPSEPEVTQDEITGLYEMRVKYAKCK